MPSVDVPPKAAWTSLRHSLAVSSTAVRPKAAEASHGNADNRASRPRASSGDDPDHHGHEDDQQNQPQTHRGSSTAGLTTPWLLGYDGLPTRQLIDTPYCAIPPAVVASPRRYESGIRLGVVSRRPKATFSLPRARRQSHNCHTPESSCVRMWRRSETGGTAADVGDRHRRGDGERRPRSTCCSIRHGRTVRSPRATPGGRRRTETPRWTARSSIDTRLRIAWSSTLTSIHRSGRVETSRVSTRKAS